MNWVVIGAHSRADPEGEIDGQDLPLELRQALHSLADVSRGVRPVTVWL